MTGNEILEGNKLIAEFMGVKYNHSLKQWHYSAGEWYEELKYDYSWDWLMPVVEKINTMGFTVTIKGVACMTDANVEIGGAINGITGYAFIENVYLSVVHLIKWYNK